MRIGRKTGSVLLISCEGGGSLEVRVDAGNNSIAKPYKRRTVDCMSVLPNDIEIYEISGKRENLFIDRQTRSKIAGSVLSSYGTIPRARFTENTAYQNDLISIQVDNPSAEALTFGPSAYFRCDDYIDGLKALGSTVKLRYKTGSLDFDRADYYRLVGSLECPPPDTDAGLSSEEIDPTMDADNLDN
jgi:hypothetical protein